MGSGDKSLVRRSFCAVALVALAALAAAAPAGAAFPGTNGRLAFNTSYTEGVSGRIGTVAPDGSSPAILTSGEPYAYEPRYSPDGARIAFSSNDGITVMNADGTGRAEIAKGTHHSELVSSTWQANYEVPGTSRVLPWAWIQKYLWTDHGFEDAAFTPSGAELVASAYSVEEHETFVCAVQANHDTSCIEEPDPDHYSHAEYTCPTCTENLVTMNASSGATTGQLTAPVVEVFDEEASVAGNGAIVFTRRNFFGGSTEKIMKIATPGAAPLALALGPGDYGAEISPDGSRVVYVHNGEGIDVIPFAGGAATPIPLPAKPAGFDHQYASSVAFSPDGTQIAFSLFDEKNETEIDNQAPLFVAAANGTGAHKVGSGFVSSWQPIPKPVTPPPIVKPTAKAKKGRVRLDKKHKAAIGTLTCGSSTCTLTVDSAMLKLGKKKCGVKVTVPKTLAASSGGNATVAVKGKCLAKLEKAGKGALTVKISVSSTNGTESLTIKATLLPAKKSKKG